MGLEKPLKNNVELHDYLVRLSMNLGQRDLLGPSKQIARVCKLAASDRREFFGEARKLLRKLLEAETRLTPSERSEATEVLEQLEQAARLG
jgi:hypothetical protein